MYSPNNAGLLSVSFPTWAPITLFRRQVNDGYDSGTLVMRAFFRAGSKDATATDGVRMKVSKRIWLIAPNDLTFEPKVDDVIQENGDGTRWSIDSVNTDALLQFHTCSCTEEA